MQTIVQQYLGRKGTKELTVPRVLLWPTFCTPTEMLPVECEAAD